MTTGIPSSWYQRINNLNTQKRRQNMWLNECQYTIMPLVFHTIEPQKHALMHRGATSFMLNLNYHEKTEKKHATTKDPWSWLKRQMEYRKTLPLTKWTQESDIIYRAEGWQSTINWTEARKGKNKWGKKYGVVSFTDTCAFLSRLYINQNIQKKK